MEKLGALYQYLRRNINGLASQLAIAYDTNLSPNLDPSELQKLRTRVLRIEALVQQNGGDVEDLRNAIATGASNPVSGLGEAASAAAASGFIATITQWLKNIDWKKLLSKVPAIAAKASEVWGNLRNRDDDEETPDPSPTPSPTGSGGSSGGGNFMDRLRNRNNEVQIQNPANQAGGNKIMWLFGTLAVAGGALYYYKTQQKTTNQPNRAK